MSCMIKLNTTCLISMLRYLLRIRLHQVRIPLPFFSLLSLADSGHDKDVFVQQDSGDQEDKTKHLKDKLVLPTGDCPVLLTDDVVKEDCEQPNDKGAKLVQNFFSGCTHVL